MSTAWRSRAQLRTLFGQRLALLLGSALLVWPVLELPGLVSDARDSWRERPGSQEERELRPVASLGVPAEVVLEAERLIPPDATYAVALGSGANLSPAQQIGVPDLLHYWLLPRRWTHDVAAAQWVVAVSDAAASMPVRLRSPVEVAPGYTVGEVER